MVTAFCASLLCFSAVAQGMDTRVIACNLKAIGASERARYNELVKRLRAAVLERRELSDGFEFRLDGKAMTLPEVAEWMSKERLCCPFLAFQLATPGGHGDWWLKLSGPKGAKEFLAQEF